MVKELQLRVSIKEEKTEDILKIKAAIYLNIDRKDIYEIKILRKSIDARKKLIMFNYKVALYIK